MQKQITLSKEQFEELYRKYTNEILLPWLVEKHKEKDKDDEWLQKVDNSKVTRKELLERYYNNYYNYNYYYNNYYNYYYNNYFTFPEFMQKVNEVLTKIFSET